MTKYIFKFNIEGGGHMELNLDKQEFEKLSEFCDKEFPDKDWKTEKIQTIEA